MARVAVDIDGVLASYTKFFEDFILGKQKSGDQVGILSGRPESQKKDIAETLYKAGVKLDFLIFKPDEFEKIPNGVWKAVMCNYLEIDYLFDDLQHNDPVFVSDFADIATKTVIFTPLMYKNEKDGDGYSLRDYVKEIFEYLKEHKLK